MNRRIGKQVNGSLVRAWLYHDGLRPVAELDGNGALRSQFVFGPSMIGPSYMIANGLTYAFIKDVTGTPRMIVDTSAGTVAELRDADDFGRPIDDSAPDFQPFGFTGGLYDSDTGLIRFGARDYDPFTGRWTSKDPILFHGGQSNLYVYVNNDPIDGQDITGLCHPDRELDPGLIVNGCGPQGKHAVCVPDEPADVDFGPACDYHDLGYSTCGYPKVDTDLEFFERLLAACSLSQHILLCTAAAELYYVTVATAGGGAYTDSQQSACGAYPSAMCPSVPQSQAPPGNPPIDYTPDDSSQIDQQQ